VSDVAEIALCSNIKTSMAMDGVTIMICRRNVAIFVRIMSMMRRIDGDDKEKSRSQRRALRGLSACI